MQVWAKVGDKVLCVDGVASGAVVLGETYTVTDIHHEFGNVYLGLDILPDVFGDNHYKIDRFEPSADETAE